MLSFRFYKVLNYPFEKTSQSLFEDSTTIICEKSVWFQIQFLAHVQLSSKYLPNILQSLKAENKNPQILVLKNFDQAE